MTKGSRSVRAIALCGALLIAGAAVVPTVRPAAAANEIKIVVDGQPITSYDISHRIAFLKLQHKKGNLADMAKKQLIDEKLEEVAISRAHASVSTDAVDAAYARFAKNNKMTTQRLTSILEHTGVTEKHFKHYIAIQMSWPRLVQSRSGSGNQDANALVAQMLESGKQKPSTTEYILQQVIFLVPAKQRGALLGQRKREAEAMRQRFQGCDTTRDFAAKLRNVAVRDLGRIMQPELPPDWKSDIEKTSAGRATAVHVTPRGAEFIGICSAKTVSDDLAAASVFNAQQDQGSGGGLDKDKSDKILAELRKHATITYH